MTDFFYKPKGLSTISGRCYGCENAEIVYAQDGWSFVGCNHEPYHGEWTAEIKDCPKESET